MIDTEASMDRELSDFKNAYRRGRKLTIALTIIPILLGGVLLITGLYQIQAANEHTKAAKDELELTKSKIEKEKKQFKKLKEGYEVKFKNLRDQEDRLRTKNEALGNQIVAKEKEYKDKETRLSDEIRELQQKLTEATNYQHNLHVLDWTNTKLIYSFPSRERDTLEKIIAAMIDGVQWRIDGRQPETGFDSPGFAMYILSGCTTRDKPPQCNIDEAFEAHRGGVQSSAQQLSSSLDETDTAQLGDLIFYEGGYVMFFFQDGTGKPFVIGMTPFGILPLEPNFAKQVAIRKKPPRQNR